MNIHYIDKSSYLALIMGLFDRDSEWAPTSHTVRGADKEDQTKPLRLHAKVKCLELPAKYVYRRAYSELRLLEATDFTPLREGHSYHFITSGDCDALSFLKLAMRGHTLDHLLFSTWCMGKEDIRQLQEWVAEGLLRHMDAYVGEIFPTTYATEFSMIQDLYNLNPSLGRYAVFRNHSKVFAGVDLSAGYYFGIQSSANINTNPRTENACITISKDLYTFYKDYYDSIKPFK